MKRVWALVICVGFATCLFMGMAQAQQTLRPQFSQSKGSVVTATVGTSTLNISGYQSPYSSIILKTKEGVFLASTTADSKGYFSISNVLINGSELTYCFQATDFKRVGISESCTTIPGPINGTVTYSDVFLPPTIALSRKQINAGQDAIIFGYTMPGASVQLTIQGEVVTLVADENGFYAYTYKNVPPGKFSITAKATLADKPSLDPLNKVELEALTLPQRIAEEGKKATDKVKETVPFNILPYLLIALALLTAIGILLYKLKFKLWVIFIDFFKRKKKMHHDWFLEKW